MIKSLVALTILGVVTTPAIAQTAPATGTVPAAKPPMVKKRVCETVDEDPYSRLGSRKICRVIEVPAPAPRSGGQSGQQAPDNHTDERG